MRKYLVAVAVICAALSLASGVGAAPLAATPNLPPGWSHAEINVIIKHVPHTLVYDRGRVQSVTPTSLTLRERDGSIVTVEVAPTAQVKINGQPSTLSQVRRLEMATTLRVDGDPASKVTVQIPPGVAAAITAQQTRTTAAQTRIAARRARRAATTGSTG